MAEKSIPMAAPPTDTDPGITGILDHIERLISGDLQARGTPKEGGDELEAVTLGLNRLAEVIRSRSREHDAALASLRRSEQRIRDLSESEARWESLADNAPDHIMIIDPQLRVSFVNHAPPGIAKAEVVGSRAIDLVADEDRGFVEEALVNALRTGKPCQFETRGLGPHGAVAWYNVQVSPVFRGGSVSQLVIIGRDVTERHEMFQALRASESRYRHLWDNLNDAAFIADAKTGYLVETNARAERLLGLPRDRLIGMHQSALHPAGKAEQYAERFGEHVMRGGTLYDAEVRRGDGTVVPVDISAASIEIGGEHLILGLFHDITRRKAMMRELEFTNFAVEHASDAVFWMDRELRFLNVNREACRRLGYTREELLERSVPDIAPEAKPEVVSHILERLRETGSLTRRSQYRRKDGSLFPVEVSVNSFRFDGREYICSIARDITEREAAERTILERDTNLQALADNANDGIAVGMGTHHVFVNERFAAMLGYPSTGALLKVSVVDLVDPSERQRIAEFMQRRRTNEEPPLQYETALLRRDGSTLPVEITVAETIWSGEPAHLIVIRDITTRKAFERALNEKASALQAKSDDLEQVNRELQQLIHVIAHDLKAPLRAVSQLATVLAQESGDTLSGESLRVMELMQGRVERMHALIEALLSYSSAGRQDSFEEVDVQALLVDIVNSFPLPASFEITLGAMPRLRTQRLQLRQVLANLIGNAIEHHDRLDGRVEVACRERVDGYEFTVTDNGPGIPPQYHELIFEMFQSLQPRDCNEYAGVRLALARKLVEGRGGSVTVESGRGRGTTFRFHWPNGL